MSSTAARREETRESYLKESAYLRFSSPLFSALSRACADDSDLLELGSRARPGQPAGTLVPMVAQYLLLKSPGAPLGRYFLSVTDTPEPASEAFPSFREFCLDHREEFGLLVESRTVNSTLVERSSTILPALAHVGELVQEPLTLVEICCSIGVNLLFDEYYYDYGPTGRVGPEQSCVRLDCRDIGSYRPPVNGLPRIAQRVGVDLMGLDLSDPNEHLWMQAVLAPEWREERKHIKTAVALRASRPIRILLGDALEVLPGLLADLTGALCVLHTHCMGQWSEEAKLRLDQILREAARDRDVHRIAIDRLYQEPPEWIRARLKKLVAAGIPLTQKSMPSSIEHTWYTKSAVKTHLLGQADGLGGWIDWQVPA